MTRILRLLIVEDCELNREMLICAAQDLGFVPTGVSGLDKALEILQDQDFQVVMTDRDLPNEDEGLKILKWLIHHRPQTVRILISGRAYDGNSCHKFFQKPFSQGIEEVFQIINEQLKS